MPMVTMDEKEADALCDKAAALDWLAERWAEADGLTVMPTAGGYAVCRAFVGTGKLRWEPVGPVADSVVGAVEGAKGVVG